MGSSKPFWKKQSSSDKMCIDVDDFEVDVFRKLIDFLQTGCVQFTPETALGLLNAAEHYGQEDLKIATGHYLEQCVNLDTICHLLTSAQKYFHYKATKVMLQKILQFVDKYGESVLMIDKFASMPKDIIALVLSREDLQARETTKLFLSVKWCRRYCLTNPIVSISTAMSYFVDSIDFKQIPASVIMNDIKPLNMVKESILIEALAYKLQQESTTEDENTTSPQRATRTASCRIPVTANENIYANVHSKSYRTSSQRMPFYNGSMKPSVDSRRTDVPPPLPPKGWRMSPRRRSSFTESTDSIESDSGMSSIDESLFSMKGVNISYF